MPLVLDAPAQARLEGRGTGKIRRSLGEMIDLQRRRPKVFGVAFYKRRRFAPLSKSGSSRLKRILDSLSVRAVTVCYRKTKSMKTYTLLTINPGSTSTKIALFDDENQRFEKTLRHSNEELAPYKKIADQFAFRK
jgi:hypothetical protein